MPGVRGHDALAQYWLGQVTLRLRREVCWLWRERGLQGGAAGSADAAAADRWTVRWRRSTCCATSATSARSSPTDTTARHLGDADRAAAAGARPDRRAARSAGWRDELALEPVECFALAAALLPGVDSAAGRGHRQPA